MLVARETACLSLEDRLAVDAELAGNAERIAAMGDGELVAEARAIAYRLDPQSVVERRSRAERDRRVTLRPAPDVMSQLSTPANLARELAGTTGAWLRRLYATPETGRLVAMDSLARLMPDKLSHLLRLRDQRCRTPWCDAPIRPSDHVEAVAEGGETSETNGQGLCEACNYAKQAPGWRARPGPGPRHQVETTTPTGHHYSSTAPPLVRPRFVETHPGVWTLVA